MPSTIPTAARRRRRVVFARRTTLSANAALSPQHFSQQDRSAKSKPESKPRSMEPAKPPVPVDSARTGPPLSNNSKVQIDLPQPSDAEPAPAQQATAAYLFPTPPPSTPAPNATDMDSEAHSADVPNYQLYPPILEDDLVTKSSTVQTDNVDECLPFLNGTEGPQPRNASGVPSLVRKKHVAFIKTTIRRKLPPTHVAFDASRPWIVYWGLTGLSLLGETISEFEEGIIDKFQAAQNEEGGFGGGHGHQSHIAASYAGVLSLTMCGERALDIIDRKQLWTWLGKLKQPNGGFAVSEEAEVDVRGAYCSITIISLLNLPLELPPDAPARAAGLTSFTDKLVDWLSRCQTYEGGISGAPGTEAHGAYAFCALACACLIGRPQEILPKIFDLPALIAWLSARQYAPEGGFSGRTNKLVDGCYSHWVGGCWPLVDAALKGSGSEVEGSIQDKSEGLYDRSALVQYILCCCQSEKGGLRDKPTTAPDGYHTCYVLAGLSSAQYRVEFHGEAELPKSTDYSFYWKLDDWQPLRRHVEELLNGLDAIVKPIHPIFVIPFETVERTRAWSLQKGGF